MKSYSVACNSPKSAPRSLRTSNRPSKWPKESVFTPFGGNTRASSQLWASHLGSASAPSQGSRPSTRPWSSVDGMMIKNASAIEAWFPQIKIITTVSSDSFFPISNCRTHNSAFIMSVDSVGKPKAAFLTLLGIENAETFNRKGCSGCSRSCCSYFHIFKLGFCAAVQTVSFCL